MAHESVPDARPAGHRTPLVTMILSIASLVTGMAVMAAGITLLAWAAREPCFGWHEGLTCFLVPIFAFPFLVLQIVLLILTRATPRLFTGRQDPAPYRTWLVFLPALGILGNMAGEAGSLATPFYAQHMKAERESLAQLYISSGLKNAIDGGNIAKAQALLDANPRLLKARKNPDGTLLWAAVDTGNPQIVQLLIDKGADVNEPISLVLGDTTVLHCAAQRGLTEVVKVLLAAGADVSVKKTAV